MRERVQMPEDAGKVNAYSCQVCQRTIITKNRNAGTTPFMISCHASKARGCRGMMQSSFYRLDQATPHTFEWVTPTESELDVFIEQLLTARQGKVDDDTLLFMGRDIREHVKRGGLMLSKDGKMVE